MSEFSDMTRNSLVFDPAKFAALAAVLQGAQKVGAISDAPIDQVIGHSLWFARAIPENACRVVDLGSGAGIPGLVVAVERPELELVLVDRRSGRTDSLKRSVLALDLASRVKVICAEIAKLSSDYEYHEYAQSFDCAISRGLGPPSETLRLSKSLVKPGGVIVISEPPLTEHSRWNPNEIASLGLVGPTRIGAVATFHVKLSN